MSVYYGETKCVAVKRNGMKCTNNAYYIDNCCGVHSKNKTPLPKNPRSSEIKKEHETIRKNLIESIAKGNKDAMIKGDLILTKIYMVKGVKNVDGFLRVYPNYKHGLRKDGIGMPSLSPKSIGPILHGQPGLPVALNLENLHQGSKVFPEEINEDGSLNELYYKHRLLMYNDPLPYRHKYQKFPILSKTPLYSIWVDSDGTEKKITYFESRQIYCMIYASIVKDLPDFIKLKQLINDGYNIQICGYDAYHPEDTLDACYCDVSRPFGHELVLYSMLINEAPWEKYVTLTNIFKESTD